MTDNKEGKNGDGDRLLEVGFCSRDPYFPVAGNQIRESLADVHDITYFDVNLFQTASKFEPKWGTSVYTLGDSIGEDGAFIWGDCCRLGGRYGVCCIEWDVKMLK